MRSHYADEEHGPKARKVYDPSQPYEMPSLGYVFNELSSDPYRVSNSPVAGIEREIYGGSIEANWTNGIIDVFSLTALRDGDATVERDIAGSPDRIVIQSATQTSTIFDHETRISNAPSAAGLTWMAGVFVLTEDSERTEEKLVLPDLLGGAAATYQEFTQTNETTAYGIFADALWAFTDATSLELGLRYSQDEKDHTIYHEASGALADVFLLDPSTPVQGGADATFEQVTWKVAVNHQMAPDVFVYASAGNGYKAGGFNPEPQTDLDAITPFDEETVLSYEVGAKTEFFDNSLRLNVSAFHTDFSDIQVEFFTNIGTTVVDNVASAKITGLELETLWAATDMVTLGISGSLYDHEYDDFVQLDIDDAGDPVFVDNSGNPIANVPDWTLTATAQAEVPVDLKHGSLRARADFRVRDDINEDANPNLLQGVRPGEEILNARFMWTSDDENYELAIWGQNLLDNAEITDVGPFGLANQRAVGYAPPRTLGISLGAQF